MRVKPDLSPCMACLGSKIRASDRGRILEGVLLQSFSEVCWQDCIPGGNAPAHSVMQSLLSHHGSCTLFDTISQQSVSSQSKL